MNWRNQRTFIPDRPAGLCGDRARMSYQTYDVTALINAGGNVLGTQLAEGWWAGQTSYYACNYNFYGSREALLAKLDVTYADGSTQTVVTEPET